ncbi:tetratricopeptide repeat protein [bacterium]|nr:tetratricopeptide repeat protein [bacterium]MBR4567615.1 tetratricopeptide repeat protein [bacterium]
MKEKIVILEQLFAQQKNLDVIKMLIDAYMLNNQYDKAKKLYNSLPERIQ